MTAEDRLPIDALQAGVRRWLGEVLTATGLSPTKLSQECGLAPSTLVRFLNDVGVKHTLSARTIAKVAARTGMPAPTEISARSDTDPETLRQAIAAAREVTHHLAPQDQAELEAELAAEIYDALIGALLEGESLAQTLRAIKALVSRRFRRGRSS
jgi:transcriptional regulator with XRE-family HTH domain